MGVPISTFTGVAVGALLLVGCSTEAPEGANPTPAPPPVTEPGTGVPSAPPSTPSATEASPARARFEVGRVLGTVRQLAGRIGPREATSAAYDRAADDVAARWRSLGYVVSEQHFTVPEGVSWGVPVPRGRTRNVVATPVGFDPRQPYVIVGAHLDTVPQAPGAEDNASGVSVLLELSRMAVVEEPTLPTVFVAFGAEEPRGSGDDWHHFGSRVYTERMSDSERRNLIAMVSLDRVGVGAAVPICGGGVTDDGVVRELRRAARHVGVPTVSCGINRSSDHWSFERAGLPAARLGSTAYAAYHSPADRPAVVQPAQLRRTGLVAWRFLTSRR
jgi:hypothetical protein